ncbi:uncharacterized protein TNIN_148561 [Trichonephila inaurata madagascariensis]|uniref:Uncharacterized protein n=1 Tax=Trichonephila inaurata madagascariensis TaxID=2747483 RepID=A0A8X6IQ99_9ARAC|nr:uncharacterized protein TNIN_148561 [Trichonephila inaurata madagascariensis]
MLCLSISCRILFKFSPRKANCYNKYQVCICYSFGSDAEAGRMFCGIINLPQPPTKFSPYCKRILNAAKLVYEDSIQNAAKEAISENEGNQSIVVAVDGTWQKRSFALLNGVVTVTSIVIQVR